jgi:translocation protein SEC62
MLGMIILRLTLHGLMYVFGVDFWLFPNLFDEKLGVIDSFKPLGSINRRTETLMTIIIRVIITGSLAYLAWTVYDNPTTINDFGQHVADGYIDFFEWGKEKVINYGVRKFKLKLFKFFEIFFLF